MLVQNSIQTEEKFFGYPKVELSNTDRTVLFVEITWEIEEYLSKEIDDADSKDGAFEALTTFSEQVEEEFDELLGEDTDKKWLYKSLSKIFAILLNAKVSTANKIKNIIKGC